MVLLILSILLYAITGLILSRSLLDRPTFGKDVIISFLVGFTANVLIFEFLSLVKSVNNPYAFFVGQILVCGILVMVLLLTKKISIKAIVREVHFDFSSLHFLDYLISGVMVVILGGFFAVGITTPPNNLDSLTTHLPRIYYWLQHGSFAYWFTVNSAQLDYPINAHIQGLWLFLLGRQETLFFLVQWFSLVVIVIAVYEVSRLLKFSVTQALVSSLILLSFPVALLQIYTFQGDLTITALVMVCIFFTFSYLQTKNRYELILAMLAIALALGTKQTAFFVLPALGGLLVYALLTRQIERAHIPLLGLVLGFFMVFSSYKYIQNLLETHLVFGKSSVSSSYQASSGSIMEKMKYNLSRYAYQFIGFDGILGTAENDLVAAKVQIIKPILGFLNLDLEKQVYLQPGHDPSEVFSLSDIPLPASDTAWFGPLCFLSILLGVIFTAFSQKKDKREYLIFSLLLNFSYVVIIILQRPGWDPYQGRYFILGTIPLVPLISSWIFQKVKTQIPIVIVIIITTLFLALNTMFYNVDKPVITKPILTQFRRETVSRVSQKTFLQRIIRSSLVKVTDYQYDMAPLRNSIYDESYYDQLFHSAHDFIIEVDLVNSYVPEGEPISILMAPHPLEYALFGINKTRDLFPIKDISQIGAARYLLIENTKVADLSGFTQLASDDHYSIYQQTK